MKTLIERKFHGLYDDPDADVQGALHLLRTGNVGTSDGPAQQTLNRAVAAVLRDLGDAIAQDPDEARRIGLVMRAFTVFREARTQRTKHLPAAYREAQAAWHDILMRLDRQTLSALPHDMQVEARRLELYELPQALAATVITPDGAVTVQALRQPQSAVWHFALTGLEGHPQLATSPDYFGIGVLSARSLTLQAAPLYDADGRFWGIEAQCAVQRRTALELVGIEFRRLKAGEYSASHVGRIPDQFTVPWPAISPYHRRQGDVAFRQIFQAPPSTPAARPWFADHITVGEWSEDAGTAVLYLEMDAVIEHPDHPSINLPAGYHLVRQCAHRVAPRPAFDRD